MSRPPRAGLCPDCRRQPECNYIRGRPGSVLDCDEFVCREPAGRVAAAWSDTRARCMTPDMDSSLYGMRPGLCFDCRFTDFCTLPKSPSGVQECEEYR